MITFKLIYADNRGKEYFVRLPAIDRPSAHAWAESQTQPGADDLLRIEEEEGPLRDMVNITPCSYTGVSVTYCECGKCVKPRPIDGRSFGASFCHYMRDIDELRE